MKHSSTVIIALLFATGLQAQQPFNSNQQAVQQTIIRMFDALSNRDSLALKLYCAPGITLYEYGSAWTIDTLISKAITLNTAADFKRVNTIDFITTTIDKNTAWANYQLRSTITANGKQRLVEWIETVILVKKKRQWKIRVLHSTRTKLI